MHISRDRRSRPPLVREFSAEKRRLAATTLALSLVAAACGAGTVESVSATTAAPPETQDGDAPAPDSLFPDISVQDVADGSAINLKAELQGGDLPVLLWFWAPH